VGETASAGFPITANAVQTTPGGGPDAFYTILDASNGVVLYSTFLGGSRPDGATGLIVDAQGVATIVGWTNSADFPTTPGAMSSTLLGATDVFVSRVQVAIGGASALVYCTLLGGTGSKHPYRARAMSGGRVAIAGVAWPGSMPAPNAWQPWYGGGFSDGFAAIVDPSQPGSLQLPWATYVGGSADYEVTDLAVGPRGDLVLTGWSLSNGLALGTAGFQPARAGIRDGMVLHLDPSMPPTTQLRWGSFLGGNASSDTQLTSVVVDSAGIITVAGWAHGGGLPVTAGALNGSWSGNVDATVARIDPARVGGVQVRYCGYLGSAASRERTASRSIATVRLPWPVRRRAGPSP